ncbi:MAG: hypothetical protein WB795_16310 [Candidatus Acidiferrales bacterium]
MERYVAGQSIREISRKEGRARETVTKIVRSSEVNTYVSTLRERFYGPGDHALSAVEHGLRQDRDARLGYRLLMDIGVVPSPGERQPIPANQEVVDRGSLNSFELASAEDENGQINGTSLGLARIAQERAETFGFELPTPDGMRHNRMVAQAIDELTDGCGLELSLSDPAKWHRFKELPEGKLRKLKVQMQPAAGASHVDST